MTKQELQAKLDELNVKYDKRWGVKRLEALLPVEEERVSEEKIEKVVDEILKKDKLTLDEVLGETKRVDGDGAVTKSGILIPSEALMKIPRTPYEWRAECASDRCIVFKKHNNRDFKVREYTKEAHGEDFAKLAQQIVDKNNK